MKGLDWGGAKGATDLSNGDILGDLEYADEGFRSSVGPYQEAIE